MLSTILAIIFPYSPTTLLLSFILPVVYLVSYVYFIVITWGHFVYVSFVNIQDDTKWSQGEKKAFVFTSLVLAFNLETLQWLKGGVLE